MIFEIIEAQSGIPGSARLRVQAEATVAGVPYSLDDIYRQLGTMLPAKREDIERLLALELALERKR